MAPNGEGAKTGLHHTVQTNQGQTWPKCNNTWNQSNGFIHKTPRALEPADQVWQYRVPATATVTLHCLKPRHVDRLHMLHEPDDPDVMRACTAPIDQMRWTCCMGSYDTVPVLNGLVHGCIRSRSIEHPIMHTYTQTRMQTHKHFKNF